MPNDTNCIEANEDMVRCRFVELDKGNFGILDELFAPSYKLNLPGFGKPMRLGATKRFYQLLYGAFAGLRHNIIEQVSAENQVVTRWTARGTHKGVWMGVKPTGRRVSFSGSISTRSTEESSFPVTSTGTCSASCNRSAGSKRGRAFQHRHAWPEPDQVLEALWRTKQANRLPSLVAIPTS
jgi:hypothetical protein